jgi:hypothetical protein
MPNTNTNTNTNTITNTNTNLKTNHNWLMPTNTNMIGLIIVIKKKLQKAETQDLQTQHSINTNMTVIS